MIFPFLEIDAKIFTALGGVVSAFIAAIGYHTKVKHETKRTTKEILFLIMEMRYQIKRFLDTKTNVSKEYIDHLKPFLEQEGHKISDLKQKELIDLLQPYIREMAIQQLENDMREAIPLYAKALSDLAKEDPLLAYNLKGKENIIIAFKMVKEHMDRIPMTNTNINTIEIKNSLQSDFETLFTSTALLDLTDAAKKVARRCGTATYLKCTSILKKTHHTDTPEPMNINMLLRKIAKSTTDQSNTKKTDAKTQLIINR